MYQTENLWNNPCMSHSQMWKETREALQRRNDNYKYVTRKTGLLQVQFIVPCSFSSLN